MHLHREATVFITLLFLMLLSNIESYSRRPSQQTELGMAVPEVGESKSKSRPRRYRDRPESEMRDDQLQMVTIDLSALRPSLPGLVLYKYGDLAPKLVQIDLDSLNPELQPHVIWPQFTHQADNFGDSYIDLMKENFGSNEDIPFLSDEVSLTPVHNPKFAKMMSAAPQVAEWPSFNDLADGDIYDFLPGSLRNEELMSLHNSLPLADEVIVPLDWEEDDSSKKKTPHEKKSVFVSRGWKAGGEPHPRSLERASSNRPRDYTRGNERLENIRFVSPFGSNGWRPGKKRPSPDHPTGERELESEEFGKSEEPITTTEKKDVLPKSYGQRRRPVATKSTLKNLKKTIKPKVNGHKSWSVPKKQWGIPPLFSTY